MAGTGSLEGLGDILNTLEPPERELFSDQIEKALLLAEAMGLDTPALAGRFKTSGERNAWNRRQDLSNEFLEEFAGEDGVINTVDEARDAYRQALLATRHGRNMRRLQGENQPWGTVGDRHEGDAYAEDPILSDEMRAILKEGVYDKGYTFASRMFDKGETKRFRPDLKGQAFTREGAFEVYHPFYSRFNPENAQDTRDTVAHELAHLVTLPPQAHQSQPEYDPPLEAMMTPEQLEKFTGSSYLRGKFPDKWVERAIRSRLHGAVYEYGDTQHWKKFLGNEDNSPAFDDKLRMFNYIDSGQAARDYNAPDGARIRNLLRMIDRALHGPNTHKPY